MLKSKLLGAIRTELRRHDLSHFQEDRVVVPGCPRCKKRFFTVPQFITHINDDALPRLLDPLSEVVQAGPPK